MVPADQGHRQGDHQPVQSAAQAQFVHCHALAGRNQQCPQIEESNYIANR